MHLIRGMATVGQLLEESKMLGSKPGQTTITAAFIDDVFSIVTHPLLLPLTLFSSLDTHPPLKACFQTRDRVAAHISALFGRPCSVSRSRSLVPSAGHGR